MKITVLGANGKTGRIFVDAAITAGHEVVAAIYRHNDFADRDGLTVRSCDLSDRAQVVELISGCDAVVSLIGHGLHSPATMQTDAMKVVAKAMKQVGITRIVSITGDGVREPGDKVGLVDWAMNASIALIDPKRIRDGIAHARYLQETALDYTIIRVLKLTNGPLSTFTLSANGPAKIFVSRRVVAAAILDCLQRETFVRQLPIITRA